MSSHRQKLTAVMPTFNCACILKNSLHSVRWADEIIVVDMGSTDSTISVAKSFGAKILKRVPRNGNFDENRKYGMDRAKGDWILKLDSDEELSPELQEEIKRFLSSDNGTINGLNLYNRIFMFGKQIKHGFVKKDSHELRMFRNGKWRYFPFRFHQQITIFGRADFLRGYYDHHNFRTVKEFIDKTNRYTDLDSKILSKKLKIYELGVIIAPLRSFLKLYFLQKGFLDGWAGFVVCFLFSMYNLVEKVKVIEHEKYVSY